MYKNCQKKIYLQKPGRKPENMEKFKKQNNNFIKVKILRILSDFSKIFFKILAHFISFNQNSVILQNKNQISLFSINFSLNLQIP